MFSFFFALARPRFLLSFPTRRSSDLWFPQASRLLKLMLYYNRLYNRECLIFHHKNRDRKSTRLNSSHVSDLVCRLLLEKNNDQHVHIMPYIQTRYTIHTFFFFRGLDS